MRAHLPHAPSPPPLPLLLFFLLLDSFTSDHVYKIWEPQMRGYVFRVSARLSCNNFPVNTVSFFMTGDNSTVYLYFPPPLGCHWTPGVVPCSAVIVRELLRNAGVQDLREVLTRQSHTRPSWCGRPNSNFLRTFCPHFHRGWDDLSSHKQ